MNLKQITLIIGIASSAAFTACSESGTKANEKTASKDTSKTAVPEEEESDALSGYAPTDTALYNKKMKELANGDTTGKWPVKNQPYPLPGAILPFKRVVTFYGNLYSKKMGALGEYAPKEMLRMLYSEVAKWEKIDPKTPVQPALHYIAVVAAGDKGKDGKYRNRMPNKQIDSVFKIAAMKKDMIVFLDIQVALSTIREELPRLEKYLMRPNVHLGIDPEFSMKGGVLPGRKIGTYDASEINYASDYLAKLVRTHKLPPKIFVVHRFTGKMVTNYKNIKLRPEVQIVMHMDGWGEPELKMGTHRYFIYNEPVQFSGFKIFYKNDLKKAPNRLMTPADLMKLKPQPSYIQYQ
ncbi:MAG: hypothetical protein WKF68_05055 [Daejeonella sp.]